MGPGEVIGAIDFIVRIGIAIHDKIEQIKANKAQCVELCKHLTIVIGHLHLLDEEKRNSTTPEFVQAVLGLKECAEKCEKLILKYSDEKRWLTKVWNGGNNERAFKRCHKQLSLYLQQMCTAIGLKLLDSYKKNTDAILSDTKDIKDRTKDIVKRQLKANKSLSTINHGQQIIATLQQNAEKRLDEILKGQKELAEATKSKPLNNTSYKIRLDEVVFDEEIPLGEEVQAQYTLYRGRLDGQPVTVKLLHGNFSDNKTLMREAEILSNLHCDKVINLLGACFERAGGLIVMEAAENGSLEDIIRNKFILSNGLKERIATEIVLGLHYLHTKKVYYKEFNAGSILFNKDWRVKLANFNRSSAQAFSISSVPLEGEESVWRAPELLEGKQHYDKKAADIYSLGLVLWSLWTDKLPYQGVPNREMLTEVKVIMEGDKQVSIPVIPPIFQKIINRCWASNPDERIKIDEIIREVKFDKLNSLIASEDAVIANFEKEYYELSDALAKASLYDYYNSKWGEMRNTRVRKEEVLGAAISVEEKAPKLDF